jgi:hypothetical protein
MIFPKIKEDEIGSLRGMYKAEEISIQGFDEEN